MSELCLSYDKRPKFSPNLSNLEVLDRRITQSLHPVFRVNLNLRG